MKELTTVCCVPKCRKVLDKITGEWEQGPYDRDNATHGYCPVCAGIMLARIKQKKKSIKLKIVK